MTTYFIQAMRVVFPSEKTAEKNPDRFATVYGKFFDGENHPLSIGSKVITNEQASHKDFSINVEKGILTLESGKRGRPVSESVSQDDINARLTAIRKGSK